MSLDIALNVLMSLSARTQDIYNGRPSEIEEFIPLVVRSASSIIRSASSFGRNADRKFEYFYRRIITDSVKTVEDMVLVSGTNTNSCLSLLEGWREGVYLFFFSI